MDELLCKLLFCQLQFLELFSEKNFVLSHLTKKISSRGFYTRWLEESLEALARNNYLVREGDSFCVADTVPVDITSAWKEWERQKATWLENPGMKARVALVEATLRALPEILTGKVPATDIIFPDSSMRLVEGVYTHNRDADFFNEVVADTAAAFIEARIKQNSSSKLRIIEMGAGTGGTARVVLQKLQPYRDFIKEYCYTDVSRAFLMHAEKEYGPQNPYLTYKLFNVELPVDGQGIGEGGYDIAIAANVLHATRDIRQTLRNVKAVLQKNGLLLINELSSNTLFTHLTFGLLEGWWLYEDAVLRIPGCPALYPATWKAVLESEGYQSVCFPAQEEHELGQQVIVAESDGIIRQKQQPLPKRAAVTVEKQNKKTINRNLPQKECLQKQEDIDQELCDKSTAYFKKLISEIFKIQYDRIDSSEPLESYGIDSILVVQLNNALQKVFENISSTLFFEYQTIDALVEYFIKTRKDALTKLVGLDGCEENEEIPDNDAVPPDVVEAAVKPVLKPELRKSGRRTPTVDCRIKAEENESTQEPIAVIGMSGRYPQAKNLDEYWENLRAGKDCLTEIPAERWPLEGFYNPDVHEAVAQGKSYCKVGGFMDGFADFDPLFFNISPQDAMYMDPQERIFLEECWKALEDAGYTRKELSEQFNGRVGVFAGVTRIGYSLYAPEVWKKGDRNFPRTSFSSVANRVSYHFNLHGPSLPVDTMCSSSLTAVHEACKHLLQLECEMAIAGGVNLYLHPLGYTDLCANQMISADGRVRSFGKGATGFVPGEGVGVIILKRLSRAIEDNDHIYAVIRGTNINHGGKTNGFTIPNPHVQAELIRTALDKAGINARTVSYIEAHGAGTDLGDPIEITGLTQAFSKDTTDTGYCTLGAVKSNLGHLEGAAGIAGLTKVLLQLKHRKLVPSLHAKELNPNIDFGKTPFTVQQELADWKRPVVEINGERKEYLRIAGVSAFGAGGSNAHVIVEEYIPEACEKVPMAVNHRNPAIVVLSAKNETRLREQVQQLLTAVRDHKINDDCLAEAAYTLQVGREGMNMRLATIAGTARELEEKLQGFLDGRDGITDLYTDSVKRNKETLAALTGDEEMQETVEKWIKRKKYRKIIELWVKGLNFDWKKMYGHNKPARISLPTYPFAGERFWLPEIYQKSGDSINNGAIMAGGQEEESGIQEDEKHREGSFQENKQEYTVNIQEAANMSGRGRRSEMMGLSVKQCLEWDLKEQTSQLLSISRDQIDIDENFIQMGFNSIHAAKFSAQLAGHFGCKVPPSVFFGYPTVAKLVKYYITEHKERVERFYQEDTGRKVTDQNSKTPTAAAVRQESRKSGAAVGSIPQNLQEPIAIIGMSGRFPGCRNIDEMWTALETGQDMVKEIPEDRFDWRKYYGDPLKQPGTINCTGFGSVPGVREFDPLFFEISPLEAEIMDPRQRLLLQEAWRALEDAGYGKSQICNNKIGMFIGVEEGDYYRITKDKANVASHHNGILAARLAYFLDLSGPVMAINTACSSALTATYQACLSLRNGECDTAIVGGVNLLFTPDAFIEMCQAGMMSNDGKCFAFDKRANGMVSAEAAVAVVLKRLSKAEADGDPIYAVIRGCGINYDGKTNGITAPNGVAQTNLLKSVYDQYKIDPEEIEYIVAHGTGTKLGDPIEVNALYDAFKGYTNKQRYCALTSTKTNFGHTLGVSGLVSLVGLVQAIRHETIPASLNCQEENDYINWEASPFYVNKAKKPWKKQPGKNLLGAVSAFGMSGTNVHMVVQGIMDETTETPTVLPPYYLLVLSAKTREALQERIHDIIGVLENKALQEQDLYKISYTLLEGRQHFHHRCAVVAGSAQNAVYILKQAGNKEKLPNLFHGKVPHDHTVQKVMEQYAQDMLGESLLLQEDKDKYKDILCALADIYCQGYDLEWGQLFGDSKPRRVNLPAYPFSRENYWFSGAADSGANRKLMEASQAFLHPLLHQNTSNLSEQRFTSTFTGQEFFLTDHVVKEQKVLPGVAYLEMARAAVEHATRGVAGGQFGIHLKNIIWARRIEVGHQPVKVEIGLYPEENGEISYVIHTASGDEGAGTEMCSQGSALICAIEEAPVLDIKALQEQCGAWENISSQRCYEVYREAGIQYGPAHQGIAKVYAGGGQILARLQLPSAVSATQGQFVLHPSLMDAALQSTIWLMVGSGNRRPFLPFALDELHIYSGCTAEMWAYIRYSGGSKAGDKVERLDITLCDDNGRICVDMLGFSTRAMEGGFQTSDGLGSMMPGTAAASIAENLLLSFVWDTAAIERIQPFPSITDKVVIIGGTEAEMDILRQVYHDALVLALEFRDTIGTLAQKLQTCGSINHIVWIATEDCLNSMEDDSLIESQEQGVIKAFRTVKALLDIGYRDKELGWTIITTQAQAVLKNDWVEPAHASLHGFAGSMAKEYTNWKVRLIDLEDGCDWPAADIFTIPADPQGNSFAYRGMVWYRQQLVPFQPLSTEPTRYRNGGTYVVIGGAGGIGEVWSEYMIKAYGAQIIWIGRRQKDEAIQAKLDRLAALGPAPMYMAADAVDRQALQKAYAEIKQQYSRINGVVHSAVVLSDQSLSKMTEEQFRRVLSSKVDVSTHMAQVFQNEPLDFAMFFSSTQSLSRSPGQSNYASGCTFKDAFAQRLSKEWTCAVKVMNWGYWGSAGVVAAKPYRDRMEKAGIGSTEPEEGMEALERLLSSSVEQLALVKFTKLQAMIGVNMEERLAAYPESIPSSIFDRDKVIQPELKWGEMNRQVQEMENRLSRLLWGQLQSMGMFEEKQQPLSDLSAKTGCKAPYDRWLEESIEILARNHYLTIEGKFCTVVDTAPLDMAAEWRDWSVYKGLWVLNSDMKAQALLAEAVLAVLPEILTGKVSAADVMFPDFSMELVEGIYINNTVADYFSEALGNTLTAYMEGRLKQDPAAQIRIIEIGAGTGLMLLPQLQPYQEHIKEYCYTGISRESLLHAQKEYSPEVPYLTYKIFNPDEPAAGQDMDAAGYDVVIAAHGLHAAKNIRKTLRNVKEVLKKNGLLLLKELGSNLLFNHMTFGLLESWWRYEDPELRIPGCPGLYPDTWKMLLESEGFRSVFFTAQQAHEFGQQVIAAESDGMVRQKRPFKPTVISSEEKADFTPFSTIPEIKIPQKKPMNMAAAAKTIVRTVDTSPVKKQQVPKPGAAIKQQREISQDLLKVKSTDFIKNLVGETLRVPVDRIDSHEPLEKYGIDSILVVQLTNALRKVFDNISSTLLFEYQTIDVLVEHFMESQRARLMELAGLEEQQSYETPSGEEANASGDAIQDIGLPAHTVKIPGQSRRFLSFGGAGNEKGEIPTYGVRDIAIIGLAGRYPQAENINEFWENIKDGKNCITEIPKDRWDWREYYHEEKGKKGKIYAKYGGFLKEIDKFDSLFFKISPKEAEMLDPQERLFLETVYECIEDAGYTPGTLGDSRKVGVFVGVMNANYTMGAVYWAIANRVSYTFNFQGPSIAVDTACSSSLTAIHLAVESLRSGTCECAVAGGVNLIVDPFQYLKLTMMTMLSSGDRCKAFGEGGDGFVDGEGVGAILLKPLEKAIADGDQIYGVIKGSMVNAGGKTNGFTVPNPNAQFQLVAEAFQRAGVNAGTISYIEAHGTGTSLGDPIEISGLTRAFEQDTKKRQFCSIGSVKSNIGHLESAAGIAGVTKVLLQMKHRMLAPSLHSSKLNPNIDFIDSPFVVQQELEEWKRPVIDGEEVPRRAGISSFGAGGANAHVVIEEYIPESRVRPHIIVTPQDPAIIVLSAKEEEQLKDLVQRLLEEIRQGRYIDADLGNMAYTFQVGREAMEERLSLAAASVKELEGKLKGFLDGHAGNGTVYRGQIKQNKGTLDVLMDEEMQETIEKWFQNKKYAKLTELWAKGLTFNWNRLYHGSKPCRISLPTYPFAKERHWLSEYKAEPASGSTEASAAVIHPLLHQNTSDIYGLKFSSRFTGQEFFLADHVVKGQHVLPGVAYLEMVRAAVDKAMGDLKEQGGSIRLRNIIWARPIVSEGQPVQVHTGIYPEADDTMSFEIYSDSEISGQKPVIHSQGIAELYMPEEIPVLDITALQEQCSGDVVLSSQCYEAYGRIGMDYGPGHRGVEKIYIGQAQVLAKLSLPSSVTGIQSGFVLHPSIMDSALHASIGLVISSGINKLMLPFALDELEILGNSTEEMWAYIRYSNGSDAGDKMVKTDIDLCNAEGVVCTRWKGLTSRAMEGEAGIIAQKGTLLFEPIWKEHAAAGISGLPNVAEHVVILCEAENVYRESIETRMKGVRCICLRPEQEEIDGRFRDYAVHVFDEIRDILKRKHTGKVLVQLVAVMQKEQQLFAGLSGMLKTAQLENPKLLVQMIEMDTWEDTGAVIEKLIENSVSPADKRIQYRAGKRYTAGWGELAEPEETDGILWKDGGIYLITGGAGGLGLIFAKEIANRTKNITLILTGRSRLSADTQARLGDLKRMGAKVEYRQMDVTRKEDVFDLISSIQEEFGELNGIIHSAGVIRDNYIIKKTREELQEVLAPKVSGLVYLDEASCDIPLDFFITFSSASGCVGNPGQVDYSAANAFMDAYAVYRASKGRNGRMLSVNWPLWKEGGMQIDPQMEKAWESMGVAAIETPAGIRALYKALASGREQVMVVEGEFDKIREALLGQSLRSEAQKTETVKISITAALKAAPAAWENKTVTGAVQGSLREKAVQYLKNLLSSVINLSADRIDADASMDKYGIDSIMIMQMTNQLENTFGSLPKTLFFEYQSIQTLTGYFLETYHDRLVELMGLGEEEPARDINKPAFKEVPLKPVFTNRRLPRFAVPPSRTETSKAADTMDIAIIGMSGHYPQARNIREFWKNLRDGRDCISEIPKDRWDHSLYFDEDKNAPGKTYSKWGGFIEDVDRFDPMFFNISPREAEIMDPQERVFLQCVYETLEDAGYTRDVLGADQDFAGEGNVGVFVGVMYEEYPLYGAQEQVLGRPLVLSGSPASIANRVSYFCNFHGPSMAVDTMCSSSLTAIHLACQNLQRGSCELAVAGGVNVSIHPNKYLMLGLGKFVSSKGLCESFGQGGDGYVPGEGVGAVLLKPLSKAVADGDHIYGVIKGTAINHGGKTNGYSVPNPNAQAGVIERALREAGIDPRTVSYMEAHGTGTSLGDPIEIAGLSKAFKKHTQDKQFCAIGSAKSNIGHCESAAGIAGLAKVLLQMKHGQLVPSLHSEVLNPNIDFINSPFVVQQELTEWKRPVINGVEIPRRAGVSSFGAGGANGHIVIEEYSMRGEERTAFTVTQQNPAIIVLSAKNEEQLKMQVQQLLDVMRDEQYTDACLADMAYTLQVGREAMEERLGLFAGSIKELEEKLRSFAAGKNEIADLYRGHAKQNKGMTSVFTMDEEMQETVEKWIQRKKYGKLLELWVNGLALDWNRLYDHQKPYRISLPTYPFSRERYWAPTALISPGSFNLKEGTASDFVCANQWELPAEERFADMDFYEADSQSVGRTQTQEDFEVMSFAEDWQEQVLQDTPAKGIKTLVCMLSDPGNQQAVVEVLQNIDKEIRVIFISQGADDREQSNPVYGIVRNERSAYEDVFSSIRDACGKVDVLLYLWPLEDPGCIRDYSGIVYILQGIAAAKLKTDRILTAGQFDDLLNRCYLESLVGFERSMGLVLPNTQFAVMIQETRGQNEGKTEIQAWMKKLWAELQTAKAQSVLYKEGKRYVYGVRPQAVRPENNPMKAGGTYFITGGCGGIGFLFAKHFAKTYHANLILSGRSPLDPDKQSKINELEALGSKVMYIQADVCDSREMKKGLDEANMHFGGIHGVIHAAGLADSQSILDKEIKDFERVIAPKIKGTLILDELLAEESLDFLCYFSSSAAILGDFGTCDYAVGNRFQMAYARHRNEKLPGRPVVINWPLWKEGGMGFTDASHAEMYLKSSGQRILEAQEGIEIFEEVLSQGHTQCLVVSGQRSRVYRFLGLAGERPSAPIAIAASTMGKGRREELRGLTVEQCLEWDLKEQAGKVLKISRDRMEADRNLADFGFDSVSLAEFAARLTQQYGIEITPALFFGYSTVKQLCKYFSTEHKKAIMEFYREEGANQSSPQRMPAETGHRRLEPVRVPKGQGRSIPQSAAQNIAEPIAIIGMSGRFPGARNIDEMWRILAEGRNVVTEIPPERFDWRKYYGDPVKEPGKINCKWMGSVPGVGEFDPLFFEISPREAELMDPRQRLLLQESWKALEDAGYGPAQIGSSRIGMYVGVEEGDYQLLVKDKGSVTSNHTAILASRLAYYLNLSGPVLAINTACSSSLAAAHQACLSLRNGECDTAIAAGVSLILTHESFAMMSQAGMLSGDGRCYAFDKRANGMVPGEAVAAVILKPLTKAEADGDSIYAVIHGSGMNYDGKTNGITAPSGVAQANLLKTVYDQYKINPEKIEYIVTHGTGTKLGDPIEVNALNDAFKSYTKKQGYCALTSTKTNFGHTLAASGLVSLISLVQAFKHETIPASLHCEQANDYINWKESPFYVNKTARPWPKSGKGSLTGAVSSFGMSGTNVHMVLQSYSAGKAEAPIERLPYYLLALSAKTQEALQEKIKDMAAVLENKDLQEHDLYKISYTLLEGRQNFNYRYAMVVKDRENAVYVLKQAQGKEKLPNCFQGKVSRDFTVQKMMQLYVEDMLKQSQSCLEDTSKYKEILYALADLYCQGYEISWAQLFGGIKHRRVSLPSYPFSREHYWIPESEDAVTDTPKSGTQWNEAFYADLIDKVINDKIDVDTASQKVKNYIRLKRSATAGR